MTDSSGKKAAREQARLKARARRKARQELEREAINEVKEELRDSSVKSRMLTRARQRVLRDFEQREHLRMEVDCRHLLRELRSIEGMLTSGVETIYTAEGEMTQLPLTRERITSLSKAAELKWKRLSLALPPLKPTTMPVTSPLNLGPLETNEDRLTAMIVIAQSSASGEISHDTAEALMARVERVHNMATSHMLDELMERIDRIEEANQGRVINARSTGEPPPEADEGEFHEVLPQWGQAPQDMQSRLQPAPTTENQP